MIKKPGGSLIDSFLDEGYVYFRKVLLIHYYWPFISMTFVLSC